MAGAGRPTARLSEVWLNDRMDDPIAKMLLPDSEFARLSTDEKFAYILKVLQALLAEHAADKSQNGKDNPAG